MLTRKIQTFSKLEKIEGTPDVTTPNDPLADADGILGLEPTIRETKEEIEIPTATATLSREKSLLGVETGEVAYGLLLRGLGLDAGSVKIPEWDRLARVSGMQRSKLTFLEMAAAVSGEFLHGETIDFAPSGASATVVRDTVATDGERLYYEGLADGPVADTDTVTGATSGATCAIAMTLEAESDGYKYVPDSVVAASATHGGWSAATPSKCDVIAKQGSSNVWGVIVSATTTNVVYVPVMGDFADTDVVEIKSGAASGGTATLSAAPALSRTPSSVEEVRQDGMLTQLRGCRGDFTIPLAAGQPARMNGTLRGIFHQRITNVLGAPTTTTDGALQFRAGKVRVRDHSTSLDLALKVGRFEIALNNEQAFRLDPEEDIGAVSSAIGDRAPTLTIDPEMVVPTIFDHYKKWSDRTTIKLYASIGSGDGKRVTIWIPNAQITEIQDADRDGRLTAQITCALRKSADAGDDELQIYVT